jgi:hypothetical protein
LIFGITPIHAADTSQESYGITFPKSEFIATDSAISTSSYSYPFMRPTETQLQQWYAEYRSLQSTGVVQSTAARLSEGFGAMTLLDYMTYVPAERDQDMCGNCWVWASTSAIEIAHTLQNNINDRLSIQYFNSRYNNGGKSPFNSANYACNGGTPSSFASFYNLVGKYGGNKIVIPWSNENAAFMDGNSTIHSSIDAEKVATIPYYAMTHLTSKRVETNAVTQSQAIANIKNQLENGNPVYLGFYLPNNEAIDSFVSFWATGLEEESYFQIDRFSGQEYSSSGGGHAVLVTGYVDDGAEGYWQCLNSYGAPLNRPNGIFYINMYMDYSAIYYSGGSTIPVTIWTMFDVTFSGTEPTPTPNETPILTADFSISPNIGYPPLTVHFTDLSEGSPSSWKWDFGDGGGSQMRNPNHTYAQPGKYSVSLTVGKWGYTGITQKNDAIIVKVPYVKISPFPDGAGGHYPIPTDPNGDGRFEDINGNGWLEFEDPLILLRNMEFAMKNEPVLQFDFDRSGFIGYGDVVALQGMV